MSKCVPNGPKWILWHAWQKNPFMNPPNQIILLTEKMTECHGGQADSVKD